MIRKATFKDIPRLLEIFEYAKGFMKNTGNPNQWTDQYPGPKFETEVKEGLIYVMEDEEHIYGVFLLNIGTDPTYSYIEGGKWLNDTVPYGTIHRVASDGSHKGILKEIVEYSLTKVDNLRIDTHEDNLVMQNAILKEGFKYCGVIYLENGDPRLAYQMEIN